MRDPRKAKYALLGWIVIPGLIYSSYCRAYDVSPLTPDYGLKGIRFDAIMEIRTDNADPLTLFTRYWVSQKCFRIEISWCTPHWGPMDYACYPVSLWIRSAEDGIVIGNSIESKKTTIDKPVPPRGDFKAKYADYPIDNLQYVEDEYLKTRVYCKDIENATMLKEGYTDVYDVPIGNNDRSFDLLTIVEQNDLVKGIILSDAKEGRVIKAVDYQYDSDGETRWLKAVGAILHEEPITCSGIAVTIKKGNKRYKISSYPTLYHRGARRSSVKYERIDLAGKKVALPVLIEVYSGDGSQLLRKTTISDYAVLDDFETAAIRRDEPMDYSRYSDDEMQVVDLLKKYWLKKAEEVDPQDRENMKRLEMHFSKADNSETTREKRLKNLYMRCMIALMLGQDTDVTDLFGRYMKEVREIGSPYAVLAEGNDFVAIPIRWGKLGPANEALDEWLQVVGDTVDSETAYVFAGDNVRRHLSWVPYRLLETVLTHTEDTEQRFKILSLMCSALGELYKQYPDSPTDRGVGGDYHPQYVFESPHQLEQLLDKRIMEAMAEYDFISSPTENQTAMKDEIIQIGTSVKESLVGQ